MTCNRMLIMYDGKILAADTPDNLQRLMAGNSQIIAEIAAPAEELREMLVANAGNRTFDVSAGDGEFQRCALTPRDGLDLRPVIFALARERGWVAARTDAQPPFARGHLRAGHPAERGRGGGLMRIFLDARCGGNWPHFSFP